jgi:archaetidylinositol phosphate synthase
MTSSKRRVEKSLLTTISNKVISPLARRELDPFVLTYSAFAASILTACLYALAARSKILVVLGGVALLVAGFLDAIDGELARMTGKVSERGSFLDSLFDKLGESAVAVGIALSGIASFIVVLVFIVCSLLVSYVRAKAEQLGVEMAGIGVAERAERIIILAVASFIYPSWGESIEYGLLLIAALSMITIVQRVVYAYNRLK